MKNGNTMRFDSPRPLLLLPALALAPRAAIMATVFSTVPALVVAYGFHFLAPGFLDSSPDRGVVPAFAQE